MVNVLIFEDLSSASVINVIFNLQKLADFRMNNGSLLCEAKRILGENNTFDYKALNDGNEVQAYKAVLVFNIRFFPKNMEEFQRKIKKLLKGKYNFKLNNGKDFVFESKFKQGESQKSTFIFTKDDFYDLNDTSQAYSFLRNISQTRPFNKLIEVDGKLIKFSSQKEKIKNEFHFLKRISGEYADLYVDVNSLEEEKETCSYEMSIVDSSNAGILYLNNIFDSEIVAKAFFKYIRKYIDSAPLFSLANQTTFSLSEFLITKNKARIAELESLDWINDLNQLFLNNYKKNLQSFLSDINRSIKEHEGLLNRISCGGFHGDLCFSNILFDPQTNVMKLIDPSGLSTSLYYDLAKLSQSINGAYDLLATDNFLISLNNNNQYEINYTYDINNSFLKSELDQMIEEVGASHSLVILIEASLFLSMLPMHLDSKNRVWAQSITAIERYVKFKDEV